MKKIRLRPLSLFLLSVASFYITYNLLAITKRSASSETGRKENRDPDDSMMSKDPVAQMPELVKYPKTGVPFHVAMTATAEPYSQWQSRIMYYWYLKKKDLPGSDMGGFTRILHSGKPDDLMDEIPTTVVDALPSGLDMGYVVLHRPWAFVQWLEKATIEEEYIFMAEPDHIFLKPIPNFAVGDLPAGYPFFYIKPVEHENLIRKFFPEEMGPVTNIDPIGNSPVIIKRGLLTEIAPTWMNVSFKMKQDSETDKEFGWVLEMYGYAVAAALHGVKHILKEEFMLQPPWDLSTDNKFILHYTYGCPYTKKGELVYGEMGDWRFDKRTYLQGPIPRNLSQPPSGAPESVVTLIKKLNEATADIPDWDTFHDEDQWN